MDNSFDPNLSIRLFSKLMAYLGDEASQNGFNEDYSNSPHLENHQLQTVKEKIIKILKYINYGDKYIHNINSLRTYLDKQIVNKNKRKHYKDILSDFLESLELSKNSISNIERLLEEIENYEIGDNTEGGRRKTRRANRKRNTRRKFPKTRKI